MEFRATHLRIFREHGVIGRFAPMRFERHALFARDDVHMKMKHGLPSSGLIELHDKDAIGVEGLLGCGEKEFRCRAETRQPQEG